MKKRWSRMGFLLVLLMALSPAWGEPPNATEEALRNTLEVLNSPSQRGEIISKDPAAKKADAQAEALVGTGENKDKLYALAGKLMESLSKKAGGDPEKMAKILEEAQRNPAAFAEGFSAEERKLLKEIAEGSERSGTPKLVP